MARIIRITQSMQREVQFHKKRCKSFRWRPIPKLRNLDEQLAVSLTWLLRPEPMISEGTFLASYDTKVFRLATLSHRLRIRRSPERNTELRSVDQSKKIAPSSLRHLNNDAARNRASLPAMWGLALRRAS